MPKVLRFKKDRRDKLEENVYRHALKLKIARRENCKIKQIEHKNISQKVE